MAIPRIAPYPMPETLPANRVDWRLSAGRAALLIHDMQNHFLSTFQHDSPPIPELITNIIRVRDRCRSLGVPVIYSAQPGGQSRGQRGLLFDFWGDGIGTEPQAAGIVPDITPADGDIMLRKWRYSAFHRTSLADTLAKRDRTQLIICGVYAHIGCLMTATEAFSGDIQPFLVADAVADFSADHHLMALEYSATRCAMVTTTEQVVTTLAR